jgi:general secretion pathway protein G
MKPHCSHLVRQRAERGTTMIELIFTVMILSILVGMAVPMARFTVKREKERELRYDLWEMRDAIDRYKEDSDLSVFSTIKKVGDDGYPPDLDTLVKGVDIQGDAKGRKLKFLPSIPVDPMTGQADWGLRSMQDDPDSDSFNGHSVYDVYSKSLGTALNESKYKDW